MSTGRMLEQEIARTDALARKLERLYAYLESVCPADFVVEAKRAAEGALAEVGEGDAPRQHQGDPRQAAAAIGGEAEEESVRIPRALLATILEQHELAADALVDSHGDIHREIVAKLGQYVPHERRPVDPSGGPHIYPCDACQNPKVCSDGHLCSYERRKERR